MQRRSGFALIFWLALMTGLQSSARPALPENLIGSYHWTEHDSAFGGLSAIEMLDEAHMLVLGDKGTLAEASLTRDADGVITKATLTRITPLRDQRGKLLTRKQTDSEAMDLAPDGSLIVSFEGIPARFLRYTPWNGPAQPLPSAKAFAKLPRNAGFEAMARDAEGTVYAIPEGNKSGKTNLPVYRLLNDRWDHSFTLQQRGAFLPVAADFGPDGRLYILERNFLGLMGFASRLRRFMVTEQGLTAEETLFETTAGLHDNLEGLSVWRDGQGQLRATMVSDDNFRWILRTQLVEYRLPD